MDLEKELKVCCLREDVTYSTFIKNNFHSRSTFNKLRNKPLLNEKWVELFGKLGYEFVVEIRRGGDATR